MIKHIRVHNIAIRRIFNAKTFRQKDHSKYCPLPERTISDNSRERGLGLIEKKDNIKKSIIKWIILTMAE